MLLRQPPEVVKFLLQTSVLDSFTAELGQAVSGRPDAGEILESLADRGLFVFRLDSGERRYRYHRLLADLLTSRLQREDPSLTPPRPRQRRDLARAAWRPSQGRLPFRPGPSLRPGAHVAVHRPGRGLASGDPDDGATFRSAGAPGETCLEADLGRLYVQAATLLAAYRVSEAAQLLGQLSRGQRPCNADGLQWRARIDFLWAVHADRTADAPGVLDNCRAAAELMGPTLQSAPGSVPGPAVKTAWLPKLMLPLPLIFPSSPPEPRYAWASQTKPKRS